MKKKILILILVVTLVSLTGCGKKLSVKEIRNRLEENTEERTFKVNNATYATKKITINGAKFEVDKVNVMLDNYEYMSYTEIHKQITGYYDQSSSTYNLYRLSKNENYETLVFKMQRKENESYLNLNWVLLDVEKATDLILVDCTEIVEPMGQTPLRYQVYALVDGELVLLD